MKSLIASAFILLAPALVCAEVQPAAKPQSKASAKAASEKKNSTVSASRSARGHANKASHATETASHQASVPALSPEELEIAERVHVGHIACELGASVRVTADAHAAGFFYIEGKGFKYHMAPVVSRTSSVRLEDQKAGAVWLQIANKSMLMNQKLGQRLADECMSPQQVLVAEAIKKNPPPSLLEAASDTK